MGLLLSGMGTFGTEAEILNAVLAFILAVQARSHETMVVKRRKMFAKVLWDFSPLMIQICANRVLNSLT